MTGDLIQLMRRDTKAIITSLGWGDTIQLTTKDKSLTVSLTGLASKHHLGIDQNGMPANTKTVHVTVIESDLVAWGYPVRNEKGEVKMVNHYATYVDSTGIPRNYVVTETFPDETLGAIMLILGDFKP